MDLSAFYGSYRMDGWGRAAFEPSMMVSLLLYGYARGEHSSRGIERKCVEDVASWFALAVITIARPAKLRALPRLSRPLVVPSY